MIEKSAKVLSLEGEMATVTVEQQSSCSSCSANAACGTSVLSLVFSRRAQFQVLNTAKANVGENVQIAVPEAVLIKASLMMYILPLVLLMFGAGIAQSLFASTSELVPITGGLLGFIVGILFYRFYAERLQKQPENLPYTVKSTAQAIHFK